MFQASTNPDEQSDVSIIDIGTEMQNNGTPADSLLHGSLGEERSRNFKCSFRNQSVLEIPRSTHPRDMEDW